MKKLTLFMATGLMILTACSGNNEKEKEDSLKIAALSAEYQQATNMNDSLMLLMLDIYNGLDSINMQEGLIYNTNNGEGFDRRAEVRHNLEGIKERLAANHKLLDEMEKRLKETGNENSVLTKTIEQLKVRLGQQDEKIASLEYELSIAVDSITNLNQQVEDMQEQVEVQQQSRDAAWEAYQQADTELNTVYYAIGTSKELKAQGLLEKKFLGATKVLQGDFSNSYFTKGDKRSLTEIPTNSKKAKVLTKQPESSYSIIENADKTKTLKITNPEEFWRLSPYLVIEID